MRRIAAFLAIVTLSISVSGCKNGGIASWFGSKTESTAMVDPYQPPDETMYQPVSYPVYNQPAPVEETYTPASHTQPTVPNRSRLDTTRWPRRIRFTQSLVATTVIIADGRISTRPTGPTSAIRTRSVSGSVC